MPAQLPAVLVGILIAGYWLRVLHLARKVRRNAGHGANVVPPGAVGLITRAIWFPVVLLWIVVPIATPFVGELPAIVRPLIISPLMAWIGLAVAAAAFICTLICWKKMGRDWRMGIDPNEKTSLIVNGPFAYVRHPIYALSSVLMLATVATTISPLMIAVGFIHLVLLQLEARREEAYLLNLHGDAYRAYCARAGRFFPKL